MSKNLLRRLTGNIRRYSAPGDGAIPASKQKYVPDRGTYPTGFVASSTHVGVKPSNTKFDDVAIVASTAPCNAAAVFTKNRFQAAPVAVSRDVLKRTKGQGVSAVVVNSGCANAVTGKGGVEDAVAMGAECGKCFDKSEDTSLVMSTGVIGQRLPIRKILSGIPRAHDNLGDTHAHWMRAAKAICTTDTFPKLLSKTFSLPSAPGTTYRIAGMTKGAGMIHPNMATLLGIICTDAPIAAPLLHPLLTTAVNKSFNSISIDGDTSTNDTVTLFANGAAGGAEISSESSVGFSEFQDALTGFATELSQLVVRDGEGATKFVTIRVVGAQSDEGAKRVANSIAKSPLVKTALYGSDANWGRVLCATGYAEAPEDEVVPEETSVSFIPSDGSQELKLLVKGEPEQVDEARASEILAAEDLEILVRVGEGGGRKGEAVMWTCDFSHEYVTINGDYRT